VASYRLLRVGSGGITLMAIGSNFKQLGMSSGSFINNKLK
jgi:hypothetical protein